jgi:transcriptional regulator with XRE-family HTH domain
MTQKYLSMKTGVSSSLISAIENGQRNPTIPTLYRISVGLNVNILELFTVIK